MVWYNNKMSDTNLMTDPVLIAIVIVVILVSVILHELAHGLVAYWLGDDTAKMSGRLSFNPLRHIDWFMSVLLPLMLAITGGPIFGGAKPVPINTMKLKWGEWGFALVSIAGPLTNLILAFIGYVVLVFAGGVEWIAMTFSLVVVINIGFMVFNLIPIPPLDGSRVIYALAPDFIRKYMLQMESFGIVIVLLLVLLSGNAFRMILDWAQSGILEFFQILLSPFA